MGSGNRGIYLSPKLEDRKSRISGRGLFALMPIKKGEIIFDFSSIKRQTINEAEANKKYSSDFDYMLQISPNRFIVTVTAGQRKKYGHVNHSCNPNCGIKNSVQIVAMRDIRPGEEITIDYAMSESSDYSMKCDCGAKSCRKVVTGEDWKINELQGRYKGFFSDYILKKIRATRRH
jgi:hypothetical protein